MKNKELITKLQECATACFHCADACLFEDNVSKMAACIQTDHVCGSVCLTTSKILAGSFQDVNDLVRYCAKICGMCAEECRQHDHDHCQECARACESCKEACLSYLNN
jgi:hypothetical protein